MNITSGNRKNAEASRTGGGSNAGLGRRGVLGGLAAVPVLYGLGRTAAPAAAAAPARPSSVPAVTSVPVRGPERRYHAPLLTPGTRLLLPAGVEATPVRDYYHRPHLGPAVSAWPHLTADDGTRVDASVMPERGAPTRIAILSEFTEGWYELVHAGGRTDRVTWDARKLPFVWFYGEFGGTNEAPYQDWFYTLALQTFARNPYSRTTLAE